VRVLATGLAFPEGPVVLPDGDVAVVGDGAVMRVRVDAGGATEVLAHCGGGPNGLALEADGSILVANNGGIGKGDAKVPGSVQRIRPDGTVQVLVDGLDAPNDICVGPDGAIWFTDPRDNWFLEQLRPGRVYRIDPAANAVTLVHEGLDYPNGIGFDGDGRLVVAESRTGVLHHVTEGGATAWATCPEGAPDGFCFDAKGRAYVCCFDVGAVFVLDPDGTVVDRIEAGPDTWTTNCAIAPDGALLVTESKQGRLLAFDLGLEPRP
jgi:gluconolactonase